MFVLQSQVFIATKDAHIDIAQMNASLMSSCKLQGVPNIIRSLSTDQ